MEVLVNGKTVSLPEASSLAALIKTLSLQDSRVAVEVNRDIVPRSQYESTHLKNGDQVEIVQAIGGG
ncbi:MAG: sulfur carrier protein ThiS [Gammaproteobacteria bacterium]